MGECEGVVGRESKGRESKGQGSRSQELKGQRVKGYLVVGNEKLTVSSSIVFKVIAEKTMYREHRVK